MSGWLESLREAGEKATKGPWTWTGNDATGYLFGSDDEWDEVGKTAAQGDTEFIVLARNHWDALLDIAEKAQDWLEVEENAYGDTDDMPEEWRRAVEGVRAALAVLRADTGNGEGEA